MKSPQRVHNNLFGFLGVEVCFVHSYMVKPFYLTTSGDFQGAGNVQQAAHLIYVVSTEGTVFLLSNSNDKPNNLKLISRLDLMKFIKLHKPHDCALFIITCIPIH